MSQLIWDLVKNNNAFLIKRANGFFTTDKFSLTGKNNQIGLGTRGWVDVGGVSKISFQASLT